ncbi:MAG: hypothetical protein J5J06_20390 [Phycisphaerae bacterium]|nr:hypothetical protein [Phycisphaerae bacterium]
MKSHHKGTAILVAALLSCFCWTQAGRAESIPASKNLMRALSDELQRSMTLQMEDLEKPYFIQYTVDDSVNFQIQAKYGDITSSEHDRSRTLYSSIRVGSYDLDNTNYADDSGGFFALFRGGGGVGRAALPLDDDYLAMRQAIWRASDAQYKDAVETLTKKRAYMKDKKFDDRPADFAKASVVEHEEPVASLAFDRDEWEKRLSGLSMRFRNHPRIQDSSVQLFAAIGNTYIVNSEGTRLRFPEQGLLVFITAEMQAGDGMTISDGESYFVRDPGDFPPSEEVEKDIDALAERIQALAQAPVLERYMGPILFDGLAAAQMLRTILAEGVAGQVDPVGTQRRGLTGAGSLEKNLDTRIFPTTFRMYDNPTVEKVGDQALLGHYLFDDEGTRAERVDLVSEGKLVDMVRSRVPTRKLSGSNGHGRRSSGGGAISSAIACLFVEDEEGMPEDNLKAALLEAVENEGLEYGLRIKSLKTTSIGSNRADIFAMFMRMQQRGGRSNIGDPVSFYKVFPDGHEEMVRGCEFGQVKVRDLKRIAAAGQKPAVYNYIGLGFGGTTPATSIISPSLLFEELELFKIEQEEDTLPILSSPLKR